MSAADLLTQLAPAGTASAILGFVAWTLWGRLAVLEQARETERREYLASIKDLGEQHQAALRIVVEEHGARLSEVANRYQRWLESFAEFGDQ